MKCEYCGRIIKAGEYSCPGCGAPIEQSETAESISSGTKTKIEVKVGDVNISIDGVDAPNTADKNIVPPYSKKQSIKHEFHFDSDYQVKNKVKYGGFFVRVLATWLDWIICGIITVGIVLATNIEFEFDLFVLVWAVYDIVCLAYFNGATPGKKGMRIKVVNKDYEGLSLVQAAIRTLCKVVPWAICIGYLMVPFSNKKQGLHDHIARTYVIKD